MSIALGDAIVRLLVDSAELIKGLDEATTRVHKQGQAMTKVGKAMTLGLTLPIVGVGVAAVKTAADFDQAMRNMNAIAQLNEQQFVEMKDKVIDFSMTTRASSVDVANALTDITAAGYNADDAFTILTASSRAAGASMATVDQTSLALTATIASYGYEVEESAMIMDKFLQIVNLGRLDLPDLATSIGMVIAEAASLKVSLSEVGAAMAKMTNAGLTTRMAAFSLKSMLITMLKPQENLTAAIEEYGYESGAALLKTEGLAGMLEMLWGKTKGEADLLMTLLGNQRAVTGALKLMSEGTEEYMGLLDEMAESEGAVNRAREEQYKALHTQIKRLKGAIEVILITIGDKFIPDLVVLADKLTDAARGFRDLSPTTIKVGMVIAGLVAAIGPLIWVTGTLITSLVTIQAAMAGTAVSAGVLSTAMSLVLGPIGLLIAAFGLLVIAGVMSEQQFRAEAEQVLETVGSLEEYIEKMRELREEAGKYPTYGELITEQYWEEQKASDAAADAVEWHRFQVEKTAKALKAQADEYANLREYTEEQSRAAIRLIGVLKEEEVAIEQLTLGIQDMEVSWFSNIVALRDNVRAYEELRDKVISVGADTSSMTARFQEDMARSEEDMLLKREDLLKKHAERRAWVESGDWTRSKKQQDEAHGYWEAIMAEELAEFDAAYELKKTRRGEDYNDQITTANAAAGEKYRIAKEAQKAELDAMREVQTERILMAALEALETKEWLTIPWIEGTVSAQDYFEAVKSGLVPVSDDIRNKLGGALEWIRDLAEEADAQQISGLEILSGLVEEYYGDIMALGEPIAAATEDLGTLTEGVEGLGETAEIRMDDMRFALHQGVRPALEDTETTVDDLRREFEDWGQDGVDAADDIQREVEDIKPELIGVKTQVTILETVWASSFEDMCEGVRDLVEDIEKLKNELDEIPRRIDIHIYYHVHGEPPTGEGAQHGFHGIVSGPLPLLVGEAGPEEVHVTPLRGRGRGLTPTGEGGLTIIIEGDIYGIDDFEEAVREALEKEVEESRGYITGG